MKYFHQQLRNPCFFFTFLFGTVQVFEIMVSFREWSFKYKHISLVSCWVLGLRIYTTRSFSEIFVYKLLWNKCLYFPLISLYKGQSNKKCVSSSIKFLQNLQYLSSAGVLLYLPVSIANGWALSLNFDKD